MRKSREPKPCLQCGEFFKAIGGQDRCNECRFVPCQCGHKFFPKNGKKYCSHECRMKYGLPTHYNRVKTNKRNNSIVCKDCAKSFVGYVNQTMCDGCRYLECNGVDCKNLVRNRRGSKFCSAACRQSVSFEVLDNLVTPIWTLPNKITKISKEELSIVPIVESMGYKHVGAGDFWRRWKDGSAHCPDFVDEDNKRVFEYFGDYWHKDDIGNEQRIFDGWAGIGYSCTILWGRDRKNFIEGDIACLMS